MTGQYNYPDASTKALVQVDAGSMIMKSDLPIAEKCYYLQLIALKNRVFLADKNKRPTWEELAEKVREEDLHHFQAMFDVLEIDLSLTPKEQQEKEAPLVLKL